MDKAKVSAKLCCINVKSYWHIDLFAFILKESKRKENLKDYKDLKLKILKIIFKFYQRAI